MAHSALALARHQQMQGLFRAAHASLFEALQILRKANGGLFSSIASNIFVGKQTCPKLKQQQAYFCVLHQFALLHSFLLVPGLLKQGDQYGAALLLMRASAYITE